MKRISALLCLMMILMTISASAAFAEEGSAAESAAAGKTALTIESSTPHDGDEGVSVENLSVKIYFSKEMMPESDAIEKSNAKAFKLTDKKGKNIPVKVYYSDKERKDGLMMVVSDNIDNRVTIEGNTEYILTISDKLQASDGTRLAQEEVIKFRTLDQSKSTLVYTILMVAMMVGMVFFTSRSAKKAMEKENEGKSETVNPYKEAKRTGKSVEEIVARDRDRKAKEAEALARRKALEAELEDEEDEEVQQDSGNKRVQGPRPISAAGSQYKVKVKKTQPEPKAKTATNPKNQSGKQKNAKNKGKKKK